MKTTLLRLSFALFLLCISFTACKKDSVNQNNHFTYDGTTYNLSKGLQLNGGIANIDPISYGFLVVLTSEGVLYNALEEEFSGSGDLIVFYMFSSDNEIATGTYTYAETENAFTTHGFELAINFDPDSPNQAEAYGGYIGTIVVQKSGPIYELTFNGTDEDGVPVSAYYKGSLVSHSWEYALKSSLINTNI